MEIDIRTDSVEEVTVIRVADSDEDYVKADVIVRAIMLSSPQKCYIEDSSGSESALSVFSKDHALDIMKGLQKAIDLGWFE